MVASLWSVQQTMARNRLSVDHCHQVLFGPKFGAVMQVVTAKYQNQLASSYLKEFALVLFKEPTANLKKTKHIISNQVVLVHKKS